MISSHTEESGVRQRLAKGDRAALDELFAAHRDRLRRMVTFRMDARLRRRLDPDDVLQEAFLAAEKRLGSPECSAGHSPFIWLRVMVEQALVDAQRQHFGAKMRDANRERDWSSISGHFVGHLTTPSRAAERQEIRSQVEEVLATMNPNDREILVLRHLEELTNGEVAELLGLRPKAASIRYIRALERFRKSMKQTPGGGEG